MAEDELKDTDELFPISFPTADKTPLIIALYFHHFVTLSDESKPKDLKELIGEGTFEIVDWLQESGDNEALPFNYELLAIFYHTCMLSAHIKQTASVEKIFGLMMAKKGMKATPEAVKQMMKDGARLGKHYVKCINTTYGHVPLVKHLREVAEQNWKVIRKND